MMRTGLGDTIALLDGLDAGAVVATAIRAQEKPISARPVTVGPPTPSGDVLVDGEFMNYMNTPITAQVGGGGVTFGGGSNWTPGVPMGVAGLAGGPRKLRRRSKMPGAPRGRVPVPAAAPVVPDYTFDPAEGANLFGGSNYFAAAPLTSSNAGLAGDMAMLDRTARAVGRQQTQAMPGAVREISIGYAGGANFAGGSSYFPGAALTSSSAGLSGAGAGDRMRPAQTDGAMRRCFANARTFTQYLRLAGNGQLNRLENDRRSAQRQRSPRLVEIERRIAAVRLLRTRAMSTAQPIHEAQLRALWIAANRDATTTAQVGGAQQLSGVNIGLAGLEGRLGRKIRKGLKQGLKVTAKMAGRTLLTVAKTAGDMYTGGAVTAATNAMSAARQQQIRIKHRAM